MQQRGQQVTNHQNGQVGRTIIGTVMVQFFAADRAGVAHLQIALQHRACAAIGALAAPAAQDGGFGRALFGEGDVGHRGSLNKLIRTE